MKIGFPVTTFFMSALAFSLLAVSAAKAQEKLCTVPQESFLFEPTSPRFLAALSSGNPVTIVAIGGASTAGRAADAADRTWPAQFGDALRKRFPKAEIKVENFGKRRQTAADMVERFAESVMPVSPALVVWETGTVDAVRNVDLDGFRETLETGIDVLKPSVDVVLMDTQFSRRTNAMIDFEPYERAMRLIADINDVPLFPRNELMRHWSEEGEIDLSAQGKKKRVDVARRLYRCIGDALAEFVTRTPVDEGAGR
jgi:lysophospholipase L1-like esterase